MTLLRALPWLILVAGFLLFALSYRTSTRSDRDVVEGETSAVLDQVESAITQRLEAESQLLLKISAFFESSESVERDEYHSFVTASGALSEIPERRLVGWAKPVRADDLAAFVETLRAEVSLADRELSIFDRRDSIDPLEHLVVTFVEPRDVSDAGIGFDIATDEEVVAAFNEARKRDVVIATRPVPLPSDETSSRITTLVSPLLPSDVDPSAPRGVAFSRLDASELVGSSASDVLSYRITDVGAGDGSDDRTTILIETSEDLVPADTSRSIDVAGRRWLIELGADEIDRTSWWLIVIRSLPTLVAALAIAGIVKNLARSRDLSERRAQELTSEIVQKNEELIRSNEWLESFTRVASHDLRSPLRAVHSLVGFIREDHPDLDESAMYNLGRIDQRVDRMNILIDDLLTLARVTDASEKVSTVNFAALVTEVIETVDVPQGFTIETTLSGDPTGELAAVQFKTCVQNLLDNALQHHDEEDGLVVVDVRREESVVVVTVTDGGPGIPEQYLMSIFEPFRRLRPDDTAPGSGIGLTAILRTAAMNQGSIDVTSTEGIGTTFTLTWPLGERSVS